MILLLKRDTKQDGLDKAFPLGAKPCAVAKGARGMFFTVNRLMR